MPRYIIIKEDGVEMFDGTFRGLQDRLKTLWEITGKVPIWSHTGTAPKQKSHGRR